MKDYKRLTKRNDEGTFCIVAEEIAKEMAVWQEQHATGELAPLPLYHLGTRLCQLEDKIENGTLIEPPCKVGDEVYMLPYAGDKITSFKATAIGYWGNGVWKLITPSGFFAEWGWAAFPTMEDAEKRLKIVKIADKLIKNGRFQGLSFREAVNKIVGQKRILEEIASE